MLTRIGRGNWERDYRTSMGNGIPNERRELLINRGILPRDENAEGCIDATHIGGTVASHSSDTHITRPARAFSVDWSIIAGAMGNSHIANEFIMSIEPSFKYIKSYNYSPDKFNFHKIYGDNDTKTYLGIELEVDSAGKNDDNAKLVMDVLGEDNVYCVHDGSLTDGFEIVTHPCTLDYHLNLDYEELFNKLVGLGYKSHDTTTCGLHIHFNKNFFGESRTIQDLCITKLLYLFEKYWDNIAKFSRRNNNKYASRYGMEENDSMFEVLYKAKAAKESYNGRYRSINLKNENTVEIRVFKGTLKYNTFVATLQFVNKLVVMCRDLSIEDIQLITWSDIVKDVDKELGQYLEERKLV